MRKSINSLWKDYKAEVILTTFGFVIVALLVRFTYPATLAPGDAIQAITVIVLVIVTVSYAIATHRIHYATSEQTKTIQEQVETSKRAVDIALSSEMNSAEPIIKLSLISHVESDIFCSALNIGRGPALNVEVWLTSKGVANCRGDHNPVHYAALGVNEQTKCTWNTNDISLPLSRSDFAFVAKYNDIFGRDCESRLEYDSSGNWEFYLQRPHYRSAIGDVEAGGDNERSGTSRTHYRQSRSDDWQARY